MKSCLILLCLLLAACDSPTPGAPAAGHDSQPTAASVDSVAPVWRTSPRVISNSSSRARLEFQLNEAGEVGWRLFSIYDNVDLQEAAAGAFYRASQDWTYWQYTSAPSVHEQGGVVQLGDSARVSLPLTPLRPGTRYMLALQARDSAGNRQDQLKILEFRTPFQQRPALAWATSSGTASSVHTFAVSPESLNLYALDKMQLPATNTPAFVVGGANPGRAYVFVHDQLLILRADARRGTIRQESSLSLGCVASQAVLTARERHLYAVCDGPYSQTEVLTINIDEQPVAQVQARLPLPGSVAGKLLLSPTGTQAWIPMQEPTRVQQLRMNQDGSLRLGSSRSHTSTDLRLSVDPAGHYLYTVDPQLKQLRYYRVDTGTAVEAGPAITLACPADAPQFSADGSLALFAGLENDGKPARVDTLTGAISDLVPASSSCFGEVNDSSRLSTDMRLLQYRAGFHYVQGQRWHILRALDEDGRQLPHPGIPLQSSMMTSEWHSLWIASAEVPATSMPLVPRFALSFTPGERRVDVWSIDARSGALNHVTSTGTGIGSAITDLVVDHGQATAFVSDEGKRQIHAFGIDGLSGRLSYSTSITTDSGPFRLALAPHGKLDPLATRSLLVMNAYARTVQRVRYHKAADWPASELQAATFEDTIARWSLPLDAQPLSMAVYPFGQTALLGVSDHEAASLDYTMADTPAPLDFRRIMPGYTPAALLSMDAGGRFAWSWEPQRGLLHTLPLQGVGDMPNYNRPIALPGLSQAPLTEPTGRFLFMHQQGGTQISVWRIDHRSGVPQDTGYRADLAYVPEHIQIDSQGRFIYAMDAETMRYTALRLNIGNGQLQISSGGALPVKATRLAFYAPRPLFSTLPPSPDGP